MLLTQRLDFILGQSSQNISIYFTNKYSICGIVEIYINKINAVEDCFPAELIGCLPTMGW